MSIDELAATAALRGASGLRTYLLENRACLRDLFTSLSHPAKLDNAWSSTAVASPLTVGLCIETLPRSVQRELWSAFVRWHTELPTDALIDLVERFLAVAAKRSMQSIPADPVSLYLTRRLQQLLQGDTEKRDYDAHEMDDVDARLGAVVFVPTLPVRTTPSTSTRKRPRPRPSQEEEEISLEPTAIKPETPLPPHTLQAATLSAEMDARLMAVSAQLVVLGSAVATADQITNASDIASHAVSLLCQVMNHVHTTSQQNEAFFSMACTKLQLSLTSDDALFQITTRLMAANWRSRYAALYLEAAVLPRVRNATSVISRVFLQTILLYAKPSFATALTDGLLLPLLATPSIGPAQGEAVTRLLRENCLPREQIDALLQRSLQGTRPTLLTNESTVLVFQNALNLKPELSASTMELLMHAAASALDHEPTQALLYKSSKFATLLFTLVNKYSVQCRPHKEELLAIAAPLTSLMAKNALRAIQKL